MYDLIFENVRFVYNFDFLALVVGGGGHKWFEGVRERKRVKDLTKKNNRSQYTIPRVSGWARHRALVVEIRTTDAISSLALMPCLICTMNTSTGFPVGRHVPYVCSSTFFLSTVLPFGSAQFTFQSFRAQYVRRPNKSAQKQKLVLPSYCPSQNRDLLHSAQRQRLLYSMFFKL